MVRALGIHVDQAIRLRSTNNVVAWLSPSNLVAKIAPNATSDLRRELSWAHELVELGAPVVPPASSLGAIVHRIADRDVTFWEHIPKGAEPVPSAVIALALSQLHAALDALEPPTRGVVDDLEATIEALDRDSFATGLPGADRRLLQRAMRTVTEVLGSQMTTVHGSPHRFNIVAVDGAARLIDFETVAAGALEWDLGHLEPDVAANYPTPLDTDTLQRCRIAVSALTAAYCWHDRDRGPDMIGHARHHLSVVRRADHMSVRRRQG